MRVSPTNARMSTPEPSETVDDPNYAVARIYTEWRVTKQLALKARVENLFNEKYQPVNGYPALGLGVFGEID